MPSVNILSDLIGLLVYVPETAAAKEQGLGEMFVNG